MDKFTRFNRKSIMDRQIDTLIGLAKGIIADGQVNQAEAECLMSWLVQSQAASEHPVTQNLLQHVETLLQDGFLDADEAQELFSVLNEFAGGDAVVGEVAKASTLPINSPMPDMLFPGKSFLFTGTCSYGTRRECEKAIAELGGIIAKSVKQKLDYLIIGTYVTDSWQHETFGRKIEKAVDYRAAGHPIVIVTEEHWADQAGL